jgi:hypothetical protein
MKSRLKWIFARQKKTKASAGVADYLVTFLIVSKRSAARPASQQTPKSPDEIDRPMVYK